jgi:hypothetical protein
MENAMDVLSEIGDNARIGQLWTTDEVDGLIAVFEQIATELSWQPGTQLRDFQGTATHLAILVNDEISGGLQVITGTSADKLPYRRVWPEICALEGVTVAHITILALKKEYRAKFNLFWPLCVELWRHCVAQGATEMRLEATPDTMNLYKRIGWPLEVIGDLRMHWGEPCYLCRMGIVDVAGSMVVRALRSATYQAVLQGMSRPLVAAGSCGK